MKIGVDIDGVLANFVDAYIALVREKYGKILPPSSPDYPAVWDFDLAGGVTKEERGELFGNVIANSPNFWMHLKPLEDGERLANLLKAVESMHDIYFITDRPGKSAKFQTEMWLMKWFHLPTVLISSDKASVARGLKLDIYIDDKPSTANEVVGMLDNMKEEEVAAKKLRAPLMIMPDRPYNRDVIMDARVVRVPDQVAMVQRILEEDLKRRHG